MRPKLFRDPVHDIIAFDQTDEVERVVLSLIQTSAFQRLRRIRQLGFANLVYHGAEHSRFAHSVGVLHVARRICDRLEVGPDDRLEVLCAAALHDVGHGPFSHAIESVTGVHHETYSSLLVEDDLEIHGLLSAVSSDLPRRVAAYFGPREAFASERQVFLDIVSSQLDADRLDYILRDGLATGVKIGVYDFERILSMFQVFERPASETAPAVRRLAVSHRAREAVEGYLIARFHMFKQVYLHKAVRAAEKMLEAVLRRAAALQAAGYPFEEPLAPPLAKMLDGATLSAAEYVTLDDADVWAALKKWRTEQDSVLAVLATGLLDRRLYKTIELDPADPVSIARLIDRAREVAKAQGLDPEYAVLVDRASDTPYRPYDLEDGSAAAHIPIVAASGGVVPIEEISDIVHLLGRDAYKIVRLCVHPELRDGLAEVAAIIG